MLFFRCSIKEETQLLRINRATLQSIFFRMFLRRSLHHGSTFGRRVSARHH